MIKLGFSCNYTICALKKAFFVFVAFVFMFDFACAQKSKSKSHKKIVIYQLLPRLFGNRNTTNIPSGTIEQNGCGKFNDITVKALNGLKELQVNYVWYTGVIAHASLTDYSKYGIKTDDADVVKGRAGSPYAIRDYYDVDPDLAVNVQNRMSEFEALIKRTHQQQLKVLIDFVPNHVARGYHSLAKPAGVADLGANDNKSIGFSTQNDFYYLPNQVLKVPATNFDSTNPLAKLMDGNFDENPAKVTGNNVFSASPAATDWYETIKLNYGVEFVNNTEINHFTPIPPVWNKMRDILIYWANKGVDGFRCDVAEMVPVEFWEWVIPQVKAKHKKLIFIAEAYNPKAYQKYLTKGKFDYLYDKVGLYDGLKRLIKNEANADVRDIDKVWQVESAGFGNQMIRFLENHDEERIASNAFAGDAKLALPAMVVTATLDGGPVMLYNGQEVGEAAGISEGYLGDDKQNARTTIFEYWGVPNHQKWMTNGNFDGKLLSATQRELRKSHQKILQVSANSDAILNGKTLAVQPSGNMNKRMHAFIRYTPTQRLLIVSNFDRSTALKANLKIPAVVLSTGKITNAKELLTNKIIPTTKNFTISINLKPTSAQIIEF